MNLATLAAARPSCQDRPPLAQAPENADFGPLRPRSAALGTLRRPGTENLATLGAEKADTQRFRGAEGPGHLNGPWPPLKEYGHLKDNSLKTGFFYYLEGVFSLRRPGSMCLATLETAHGSGVARQTAAQR